MGSLSEFTITDEIHRGIDTAVHRGYRNTDRGPVAVKLIKGEYPSPLQIGRLRHEYVILRSLDLPCVVKAWDLVRAGNGLALVTEYLELVPLSSILRAGVLDLRTFLRIATSIADAIESIHARQVIHKDIKPRNIMVSPDTYQVKLIDFGVATSLSRETPRAMSPGLLEGTLAYMSPEQTGRMNRVVDHRTDLYSLGVTMYEMLTGTVPFQTTDPLELAHSHIARSPVPPRELAPQVPEALSAIVMKLLSKRAEDRYQSARGLKMDLRECLVQIEATARIDTFPLAQNDRGHGLFIAQRLYGRDVQTATLLAAWDRVHRGAAELVLVSGSAGVGKSALVNEVYKAMAKGRTFFIAGKSDQMNRSVPYASLAQAFRDLTRQLLVERDFVLAQWKRKLLAAVGPNGSVILHLIPEMELVIGPQPSAPTLGSVEAQNRFNLVFQSFLRVFTTADHPLTIFLDDLQWADMASLKLIEVIMSDSGAGHLLVIGAYRDNEVTVAHPFAAVHSEILKSGAKTVEIRVEPLELADVGELLVDTLSCDRQVSAPLATLVFEKTQGNPLFVNQFLATLHKDQMIVFDVASGAWSWDVERIQMATVTDNVVDFVAGKLRQLSATTQHVLKLAGCIGHQFDLRTLSTIYEKSPRETAAALWEALQEDMVLPIDPEYRFIHPSEDLDREDIPEADINVSFKFLHDRVQQAAYSIIENDERQELHLRIGRLLLAQMEHRKHEGDLFDVVSHMNLGAETIVDPSERLRLSRLNLTAGRRAKAGAAYDSAARCFRAGISLLDAKSWEEEYELSFALHTEGAECEYLSGRFEQAEALFNIALARTRSVLDRTRIYDLRMVLCMVQGKFGEAVELGVRALLLLEVVVPEAGDGQMAAIMGELGEVSVNLAGRRIADLINLPELTDPTQRAAQRVLMTMGPAVVGIAPDLMPFISARLVNISLKYGHSDVSAVGYAYYGVCLAAMGRYEEAYEFATLAMKLSERFKSVEASCVVKLDLGAFIGPYREPLRSAMRILAEGYREALDAGQFQYASYCCSLCMTAWISQGCELDATSQEVEKYLLVMQHTKDAPSIANLMISKQLIASLRGRTKDRSTLSDESFDEPGFVEDISKGKLDFHACWYNIAKTELAFLFEDYESALATAAEAERYRPYASTVVFTIELPFYYALTVLAIYPGATADEQARYSTMLDEQERQLSTWADNCPENFRHKLLLVSAERARVAGDDARAMDLYDEAARLARENELIHHEAMANELCAKFFMSRGRKKVARAYMAEAVHGYLRWGAQAKVAQLRERYPALMPRSAEAPLGAAGPMDTSTISGPAEVLDITSVIKASQAVSGEIEPTKLLGKLVWIAIENAGANKGFLLLDRNGDLYVEAAAGADVNEIAVLQSIPLDDAEGLSPAVVRYVHKTKERVVLGNAASESMFSFDPYMSAQKPKSILCAPIVHQGKLIGVLYLENTLTEGVFTPGRLEILQILSSQAAISIENSRLYANLEEKVKERTAQLQALQARLLRLEREATEKRMAGGFAHEIRNALAGSKLVLAKALASNDSGSSGSIPLQSAREIGELYEILADRLPEPELAACTEHIQRVFEHQQSLEETLSIVFKATGRALNITKRIMDFSRIGEMRPASQHIALKDVIDSVLADNAEAFAGANISVRTDVGEAVVVQGDEEHYHSILQNLINNARDAIVEKGANVHGGVITIGTRIDGDRCVIEVADEGVGIREEDMARIFEAFYSTKPQAGTGLGLAVVKRIVDTNGGTIEVQSALGKGSRFTVSLPVDGPLGER